MVLYRQLIFIILSLFLTETVAAGIKGYEPDYAGRTISFYSFHDPVSKNTKQVFTIIIDAKGNFSTDLNIVENLYCFAEIDIYRCKLILSPKQELIVKFPPLRVKTFEESKNPYFKFVEVWLKTENNPGDDLTTLFAKFDHRFDQLTNKHFNQLYYKQLRNYLDSVKLPLEKEFARFTDTDFVVHRQLSYKSLEADISRTGREKMMAGIKSLTPSFWNQPAFIGLLDRLFSNTLSMESKTVKGNKLKLLVNQKNLPELNKWAENYTATSTPLLNIVLLKILHDAFYSGEFSKTAILQMVQSEYFTGNHVSQVKNCAAEISEKLNFLLPGTEAPEICLPTIAGKQYCSKSNQQPFQYLLFADLEIPVCREQVKYLKTMSAKTGSQVQIFLVLAPSKKINIAEFLQSNQIPGVAVIENESREISKKYQIRSWPSSFLVNREHKVILSPAKNPLDGFELQFAGLKK